MSRTLRSRRFGRVIGAFVAMATMVLAFVTVPSASATEGGGGDDNGGDNVACQVSEYQYSRTVSSEVTQHQYKKTVTYYTVEHKEVQLPASGQHRTKVQTWLTSIGATDNGNDWWQLPDSVVNAAHVNPLTIAQTGSVGLGAYGGPNVTVNYHITKVEGYVTLPAGALFYQTQNGTIYLSGADPNTDFSTDAEDAIWVNESDAPAGWTAFATQTVAGSSTAYWWDGTANGTTNQTKAKWTKTNPGAPWTQSDSRSVNDPDCYKVETSNEVTCGQITLTLRNVSPWIYPLTVDVDGTQSYGPVVDNRTGGKLNGPAKDTTATRVITFPEDSGVHTVKYRVDAGTEDSLYKSLPVGEWTTLTVESNCQPDVTTTVTPPPPPITTTESTPPVTTTESTPPVTTSSASPTTSKSPAVIVSAGNRELPPVAGQSPAASVSYGPAANAHTGQSQSPFVAILLVLGGLALVGVAFVGMRRRGVSHH